MYILIPNKRDKKSFGGSKKMETRKINYGLIERVMLGEVEQNFCTKCKICGVVVSDVTSHIQKHMEGQ